ncbi:hypothetical protein NEF87_004833 [Candidatus Lokiarchaeum ossiferum]|uniref:Uncharacterized protein n=1 Tax=Candidatus Lokiarchaeum ossiferum TaxID=2951803 RepID=A0ABY6HYD4_9ARCH|nr:hypothetical protein NEF87_004833 [Candidatus Lokiarchaeum sp. B-35]
MIKDFWQITSMCWNDEHTDIVIHDVEYDDKDQADLQFKIIQEFEKANNPKYLASHMEKVFYCEICQKYYLQYISREIILNYKGFNIPIVYCKHNSMDEVLELFGKKLNEYMFEMP